MEVETQRSSPIAVFMAFGTKGDVYPIAAVASALACDQQEYDVVFVTHSAHHNLAAHLAERNVRYCPVSSPPVLSAPESNESDGCLNESFYSQKGRIKGELRRECLLIMEGIFGDEASMEGDFVLINFFALEGWSLAELFHVKCVVASPYVMPYTAPSSFERQFIQELPELYQYLQEAPADRLGWKDVTHWMWPLFSSDWGSWRMDELNLSPLPFTDPVTGLPIWHDRPLAPLLMYGFSREIVECPAYWPSNSRVCGFWFLPPVWQFSCNSCRDTFYRTRKLCSNHTDLIFFLDTDKSMPLVFVGLSSAGTMGFLKNPMAMLRVIQATLEITKCRIIFFTAGFEPLNVAVQVIATEEGLLTRDENISKGYGITLFNDHLYCFSGSVPYSWLFQECAVAIHHGGSGSTAAALKAGIPQIICPLMLDQFYWAERMHWLGVAPEPVKKTHLLSDNCDDLSIKDGASKLSEAIKFALNPAVKECAVEISKKILLEDGVSAAVRILKEEMR